MNDRKKRSRLMRMLGAITALALMAGCTPAPGASPAAPPLTKTDTIPTPAPTPTLSSEGLSSDEIATLSSLEQLDGHPLYTMKFSGAYPEPELTANDQPAVRTERAGWGCTLFAAMDGNQRLYGRNFDWQFSPAVLLFTNPPDGYASVSMVDIEYLGFNGEASKNLTGLPLNQLKALLEAPALPFDGMNEKGLAVGMAAVEPGGMKRDPQKKTIDELAVMREILDHAATVDEAVVILSKYNIHMGTVPLHYLIASAAGNSALVEFYQGKMEVFRNESSWQVATNFIVASMNGQTQGECPRYDRVTRRLQETNGQIAVLDALKLLENVSQENTQWSVVYDMTGGDISIIMDRNYTGKGNQLHLDMASR